jgi:D-serine deaminase-like pyridoxal phosphate-dependent protein
LVIDSTVVERNLRRMADYAAEHGLALRPHAKTHKSQRLAAMQLAYGAAGLTVAKVGEAEVMAEVADDLLLAYPAIDAPRTARLARLATRATVRVAVDSLEAAEALDRAAQEEGSTIGILVDVDVGLGRTGVQSAGEALALAQKVAAARSLRLDGILVYPGHASLNAERQEAALAEVGRKLDEVLELWERNGLQAQIVSGGSTPTALRSHRVERLTEIRPGTYIFNDWTQISGGWCSLDDSAARIECTVVSTAVPGQVVIDAGSKTLTSDLCPNDRESGYGHVVEYPEARIVKLSEEHGQVDTTACRRRPALGERVSVIPNHICPCINLQDSVWWRGTDGKLEPLSIDARGRLS